MPRRRRDAAAPCDGVLLLDKPAGLSSNAALQRARRALGASRAGHAGTLDPLATGLLVVCLGEATKFAQWPTDAVKAYEAEIELGATTTTGDAEGEVLSRRAVGCDAAAVVAAMAALTGHIEQVPPMHSALKRDGRPYYAYARAGETLERVARPVTVVEFEMLEARLPRIRARVVCSKGTYVRVLAEQLGERLGCGAHLAGLRRTRVGHFPVERAVALERLEASSPAERRAHLLAVETLLPDLPRARFDDEGTTRLYHGLPARPVGWEAATGADGDVATAAEGDVATADTVALLASGGRFFGVGERQADVVRPRRLVAAPGTAGAVEIA